MNLTKKIIALCLLALCSSSAFSQEKREFTPEELESYKEKAKDITSFYFYLLNTVGSGKTSPFEKEIIVTESYKKYFVDDEVQVEDDLDERREVPTNKNIAAYLKDVDFFFKDVRFEHEIEEVTQHINEDGTPFFKISLTRRLQGITVDNDTLNNTLPRFIEINISEEDQDLRIASIYTTKLSEKEDLLNWWKELNITWKDILDDAAEIESEQDSLSFDQIKKIISLKKINVGENMAVNNLEPLSKLSELEEIDVSSTPVDDLSPLRNLTGIKKLNAENTKIDNLEALRYSFELTHLLLDNTMIDSLAVLSNLENLQVLSIRNTQVDDLSPLEGHKSLRELYATGTDVRLLTPLKNVSSLENLDVSFTPVDTLPEMNNLRQLKTLNLSNTNINTVDSAKVLESLEIIRFDNTSVDNLEPLAGLNNLKRVYCDYTGISREQAAQFMAQNPGTLIIFGSDRLLEWWTHLNDNWRQALLSNKSILDETSPTKEELASLIRMDSLDLSSKALDDLEPLKMFHQVHHLNISGNNISTLNVLRNFDEIQTLNISHNPIVDINILNELQELIILKMEGLQTNSLAPLYNHQQLKIIYADSTLLDDEVVRFFNAANSSVLVVYKSEALQQWWEELNGTWKSILTENAGLTGTPDNVWLHRIIFLETIQVISQSIIDLEPLVMLLSPTNIILEDLSVSDLQPLARHQSLRMLQISKMPVYDLSPLTNLRSLEELTCSDTPLEDLEPIAWFQALKRLDLSSTQAKDIKYLKCLTPLEYLNLANTEVKHLNHLYNLEQLMELICYNTRITPREVENFKVEQPECRVVYYR